MSYPEVSSSNHSEGITSSACDCVLFHLNKSGISDLGLIKLKEKVHEHEDYDKGVEIVPVTLATVALPTDPQG